MNDAKEYATNREPHESNYRVPPRPTFHHFVAFHFLFLFQKEIPIDR